MSGMSLVQFCDYVFIENYKQLTNWSYGNQDILHDVYLNVRDRLERGIIKTGETIIEARKNVLNYWKKSITNQHKLEHKKLKDLRPIDESGYLNEAEDKLKFQQELEEDSELYELEVKYIVKKIFDYFEKLKIDEFEQYVFKLYYFTNLPYEDIARLHNIEKWRVNNILKKLRSKIRQGLIVYIRMSELYQEVENFVKNGGANNETYHIAMELYRKINPAGYNQICKGCRGRAIRIMNGEFATYLTINKNRVT